MYIIHSYTQICIDVCEWKGTYDNCFFVIKKGERFGNMAKIIYMSS